jgi:hypothetical protein
VAYTDAETFALWADIDLEESDPIVPLVELCIDVASAQVDEHCHRSFAVAGSASARTFTTAGDGRYLPVDDFTGTPTATVGGTAVTVTAVSAPQGRPFTQIKGLFGCHADVVVTAAWGWAATPSQVELATLLFAHREFERRQSPNGVLGSSDTYVVRVNGRDYDVEALLAPFVRAARGWA